MISVSGSAHGSCLTGCLSWLLAGCEHAGLIESMFNHHQSDWMKLYGTTLLTREVTSNQDLDLIPTFLCALYETVPDLLDQWFLSLIIPHEHDCFGAMWRPRHDGRLHCSLSDWPTDHLIIWCLYFEGLPPVFLLTWAAAAGGLVIILLPWVLAVCVQGFIYALKEADKELISFPGLTEKLFCRGERLWEKFVCLLCVWAAVIER